MVPLDNLVTVTESSGPPVITHYNLFRAVEIDGSPAPGYSSGQGLAAMEELAKQVMMPGMTLRVDRPDARRNRIQRQGAHHLRPRHPGRLSHALGAIRELRAALHHSAGRAHGGAGRAGAGLAARPLQRRLLPDRTGDAHRPLGQKLDSDCRVRRAVAAQGPLHCRCCH